MLDKNFRVLLSLLAFVDLQRVTEGNFLKGYKCEKKMKKRFA